MANSKKHGFTLIELIVVISIVGVLAAILVPAMMGYVKKTKRTSDISSAKTIYETVIATIASNDDAADSLTAKCEHEEEVTVRYDGEEDTYTLCIACTKDGTKSGGGKKALWSGSTEETKLFVDEINAVVGKTKTPVEYRRSESGKLLDRWFICYHDEDHSQIEIWVGDSKTNTPIYRIHPQRDDNYV